MKKVEDGSVLFLCQFFYPERVSSATLPFDTAKALAQSGRRVGAICGYPREYLQDRSAPVPTQETKDGVAITRLKYLMFNRKSRLGRLINYFSFTAKCRANLGKMKGYEYIFVYSNPPVLPHVAYKACKKYGSKLVFVSYDVYPEIAERTNSINPKGLIAKMMRRINAELYPSIEKLVVLSDDMKAFLAQNRNIAQTKIVTIPNWYEKDACVPRVKQDKFVVTYLGNVGTCQDIQTVLEAAKILKDTGIEFVIGGHGNKLPAVERLIAENRLSHIAVCPFLTGAEYEKQMTESDCFVLSLEKGLKGLCYPSKYYSYLAYGRPIVAVMEECQLTEEIERNRIGASAANGDAAGLAKLLLAMKNDPEACAAAGERAFALFCALYRKDLCTEQYRKLLENR